MEKLSNIDENYVHLNKILIFGDKRTGKTAFVNRIQKLEFQSLYVPSNYITNSCVTLKFQEDNKFVTLDSRIYEIDTEELAPSLYTGLLFYCRCVFFMFDITSQKSFISIKELIKALEEYDRENKIVKILIANKIDNINNREISEEEIQNYCDNCNSTLEYFKISVKNRENINSLIQRVFTIYKNDKFDRSSGDITIYESEKINRAAALYAKTVYKILLLGDGTVGKSTFFKRYFFNDFNDNYLLTVGVDDKYKFIRIHENEIKLQLWDTAGQERFRSLPRKYYQHADGILLMYDVTNRDTFNNVTKWMKDITDNINSKKKIIIYLVGNKIDLDKERVINISEAREKSVEYNIKAFEISCKLDLNVTEILLKISNDIYNNGNKHKHIHSFYLSGNEAKKRSCCESK